MAENLFLTRKAAHQQIPSKWYFEGNPVGAAVEALFAAEGRKVKQIRHFDDR
jgi:hypothetical protein